MPLQLPKVPPLPKALIEQPLLAYSRARSAGFAFEHLVLDRISRLVPGNQRQHHFDVGPDTVLELRNGLDALIRDDVARISDGTYPARVLEPEAPIKHALRLPRLLLDGFFLERRRAKGRTTEFDTAAKDYLDDLPRYYRRNFHFQTNGYLSEDSADLYEHQVEILFSGAGDAMRRLIIQPLRDYAASRGAPDGAGLTLLELGCGTGRSTRFVRMALPKARIVAVDLSEPYLRTARERLRAFPRLDCLQADAGKLPFHDVHFDAVYSVFLFHELPAEERGTVLSEAARVLKPEGFFGFVDSLQTGDHAPFDDVLAQFPKIYHEPFFRDYLARPMEPLLKQHGFGSPATSTGFLSKLCWGLKTTRSASETGA